jgi:hypothetical protein
MALGEVFCQYIPNIFNIQITQCVITICAYLMYFLAVESCIVCPEVLYNLKPVELVAIGFNPEACLI